MKITVTVNNKIAGSRLVLFGTRHNLLRANFGNPHTIELKDISFDDDYINQTIGKGMQVSEDWFGFSSMLMDCIKYDLRVVSINGEKITVAISNTDPIEYKEVEVNPYSESIQYELKQIGDQLIEIELIKLR